MAVDRKMKEKSTSQETAAATNYFVKIPGARFGRRSEVGGRDLLVYQARVQ